MYRIELSPGEETAFRTIEELAVAIRRKVVTSKARIYHNATGKWLPIQFHPHYKQALSMPLTQADLVAGPPVAALSALRLGEPVAPPTTPSTREAAAQAALAAWPEPKPITPRPEQKPSAPRSEQKPGAPRPDSKPSVRPPLPTPARAELQQRSAPSEPPIVLGTPAPEPSHRLEAPRPVEQPKFFERPRRIQPMRPPAQVPTRFVPPPRVQTAASKVEPPRSRSGKRKSKRSLRVVLAGAVLLACAHLLVTSASLPRAESAIRARIPRKLIQASPDALKDSAPRTVAAVMPGLQSIPVPGLKSTGLGLRGTPRAKPIAPARAPGAIDSASAPTADIEAAPDETEITAGIPLSDSLAAQPVDSSGKKALKRILRTIGGTPASEAKPAKR
jgi:hypothetical protein